MACAAMVLSDDEEEEEDLMDLMPAHLAGFAFGHSEDDTGLLDRLLVAQLLKNGGSGVSGIGSARHSPASKSPGAEAVKFKITRVPAKMGVSRRRAVTKLNIPSPEWAIKKPQEPAKGGRPSRTIRVGTGRKPVTKLDIRVPDWDSEKLIVEEEERVVAYFNSGNHDDAGKHQDLPDEHQSLLFDPSPSCMDAVAEYLQAQKEFMASPDFECPGERPGSPTPPANPLANVQARAFRDDELFKYYNEARRQFFESPDLPVHPVGASPATPPPLEELVAKMPEVPKPPVSKPVQEAGSECQSEVEAESESSPGSASSTVITTPFIKPPAVITTPFLKSAVVTTPFHKPTQETARLASASPDDVGGSVMTVSDIQHEVRQTKRSEAEVSTPKRVWTPEPEHIATPFRTPQLEVASKPQLVRTPQVQVVSTPQRLRTPQPAATPTSRKSPRVVTSTPQRPRSTVDVVSTPQRARSPKEMVSTPRSPNDVISTPQRPRSPEEIVSTPRSPNDMVSTPSPEEMVSTPQRPRSPEETSTPQRPRSPEDMVSTPQVETTSKHSGSQAEEDARTQEAASPNNHRLTPEQVRTPQEALGDQLRTPQKDQLMAQPDSGKFSEMDTAVVEAPKAVAKRPRGKRRSREAEASPGLQGGTKWVDGQRRSTRIRSRPLETWRGERLLYARVHSTMVTLIGVKHASPLPPWPKRGQYKYNYKVESFVSDEHEAKLKLAAYG